MRDPSRIADMLQELGLYWQRYPDLRLGQLVSNMTGPDVDVYYIEDGALLALLRRANAEGRPISEADLRELF